MTIYEINYDLYAKLFEDYEKSKNDNTLLPYLKGKFIVKDKDNKGYFYVDNSTLNWWEEEFDEKQQGIIWLVDDELNAEEVLKKYKKNKCSSYNKYVKSMNDYCNKYKIYHRNFFEFNLNTEYDFFIKQNKELKHFKSTIEDAIGLASYYNSDLLYKNILIFSPTGFDIDENYRLIKRYLGNNYFENSRNIKKYKFGVPYKTKDSNSIHFIEEKNIKI